MMTVMYSEVWCQIWRCSLPADDNDIQFCTCWASACLQMPSKP